MSHILLTSIGNGQYDKDTKEKKYSTANYVMKGSKEIVTSAYIHDALLGLNPKKVDKIILIGTTGSCWEMLYLHLFEPDSKITPSAQHPYDEEYALELMGLREKAKNDASLDVVSTKELLGKLKDTMGDICLDIIVLHYGVNEDEMQENFNLLTAAKKYVKKGDTLSFDITHSFRSLAFYEMLAVNFLNISTGNAKNIDFVSYGMFEYREYNDKNTPIINQAPLLRLLDWTKAAEEYQRFGTTYLLGELLEKEQSTPGKKSISLDETAVKAIKRLGDMVSVNNMNEIKNMIKNCKEITEKGGTGNAAIDYIFEDIVRRFGKVMNGDVDLVQALVEWHIKKKRYIAASIMTIEYLVGKAVETTGSDDGSVRNNLKRMYQNKKKMSPVIQRYLDAYEKMRKYRNTLCHGDEMNSSSLENLKKTVVEVFEAFTKLEKDSVQREVFRNDLKGV